MVTDSETIEGAVDELPVISALDGVCTVLSWPYQNGATLFQAGDPAEAVEFTARSIEERRSM
ncbi:hypothetical protein ABZ656_13805 [Streptomyces sp. NPDC007095]|jgi:hypothetical protein|uniref:hypothetical protein n=1 Tax=Streptomyces sp. NPDC007095 TaxID=3154482 RepID=UPI000C703D39